MKAQAIQLNRFVVICSFKSGSRVAFDRGIKSTGDVLQLGDDAWLLRTYGTAGSVRNQLFQHMGARDTLMVLQLDAVRTATQNFGPETDARIRALLYLEPAAPQAAAV